MSGQHRTFPAFEPKGEIAVSEQPNNRIKIVLYPETGDKFSLILEKESAFNLAMEILQHVYRLG